MVYKGYKIKICLSNMWNQLQDRTHCLFSYQSYCRHPSQYFFEAPPMQVSSLYHPLIINFLVNELLLSKIIQAPIQMEVFRPKIVSLYPVIVSLMASSSSSFVFKQFRRGIFNPFASSNSDVLFIYY